jgi:hypothetical protein
MQRKEPGQADGKLAKVTTTDIPVNKMARRLEKNTGQHAVVGGFTASE